MACSVAMVIEGMGSFWVDSRELWVQGPAFLPTSLHPSPGPVSPL
jgi:hypothetical protein